MSIVFSIRPWPGSGFTDQLVQFTNLLRLGRSLGWSYFHAPFACIRSSSTVYEFLGFDRYLRSVYPSAEDSRGNSVTSPLQEIELSDAALERDGVKSLAGLQGHLRNRAQSLFGSSVGPDQTVVLCLARRSSRQFFAWIHAGIPALPDNLNLREGIRRFGDFTPGDSDFDERPLRILIHMRLGDTAYLPTPWGTFIHLAIQPGGRRRPVQTAAREQGRSIEPHQYLRFVQALLDAIPTGTASTLVFSDGYRRILEAALRHAPELGLTDAQCDALQQSEAGLDCEPFGGFEPAGTAAPLVGESDTRLRALVKAAFAADLVVVGRAQRMLPKLLSLFCEPRLSQRIITLGPQRQPPTYRDFWPARRGGLSVTQVPLSNAYNPKALRQLLPPSTRTDA